MPVVDNGIVAHGRRHEKERCLLWQAEPATPSSRGLNRSSNETHPSPPYPRGQGTLSQGHVGEDLSRAANDGCVVIDACIPG